MRVCFVLFLVATVVAAAEAQVQNTGWLASFNTFRIDDRFSVHFDAQLRGTDDVSRVQTTLVRPGFNYHLNRKVVLTAGYALIHNRRNAGGDSRLLAEHRAWQQLIYSHAVGKTFLGHRFRVEQRFLPEAALTAQGRLRVNGYNDAHRLRYFVRNVIPVTNREKFGRGWFLALQNEVFINVGDKSAVNGRIFDQNRAYAAFGYRFAASKLDAEIGYMNQYVKTRNTPANNHIIQIAFYKRP